jgi:hypothetical protein
MDTLANAAVNILLHLFLFGGPAIFLVYQGFRTFRRNETLTPTVRLARSIGFWCCLFVVLATAVFVYPKVGIWYSLVGVFAAWGGYELGWSLTLLAQAARCLGEWRNKFPALGVTEKQIGKALLFVLAIPAVVIFALYHQ